MPKIPFQRVQTVGGQQVVDTVHMTDTLLNGSAESLKALRDLASIGVTPLRGAPSVDLGPAPAPKVRKKRGPNKPKPEPEETHAD